ncbi:hypothetical protein GWK47_006087 [Chionoecetes opilio]|uniref:Uncharacterized protein n=1 Tax=Chionoecetes opilio TaxID=41210 RepID=A0A8J4Y825_CHIOP|nr:hypothetical protein GWK47_006087 [Chionoecetes opilio]
MEGGPRDRKVSLGTLYTTATPTPRQRQDPPPPTVHGLDAATIIINDDSHKVFQGHSSCSSRSNSRVIPSRTRLSPATKRALVHPPHSPPLLANTCISSSTTHSVSYMTAAVILSHSMSRKGSFRKHMEITNKTSSPPVAATRCSL